MRTTWLIFILPLLLGLTTCNTFTSASPTPTIVRLTQAELTLTPALTTTVEISVADPLLPSATPIPYPSLTPTNTPWPSPTSSLTTLTPIAIPTPTATSLTTARVEILTTGLNVRQEPGVNSPKVATVAKGQSFEIMAVSPNGKWLQITTTKGISGWISSLPELTRITGSEGLKVERLKVEGSEGSTLEVPLPVHSAATPSGGQRSAVGGRLVFMTGSGGDLYLVNLDGSDLRRLTSGVIDPVVSPDGQQVAFTRWDGAKFGALYRLNLADGHEQVVASDIRQPKSPTWSPDGQRLIISFQHGGLRDPQPECRTFDADDGFQLPEVSEITSVHQQNDGRVKICFIRLEDLQWGLRRVDLATGQFEDLPADLYSFNPTWDPANPWRLIYDGQRGLMQLDLNSGSLTPFTTDVRDTAPVFSPDGQTLALTYKQHDHWEVYTLDPASGARQRLTKPGLLERQYNSAAPAWSPDGSQLAFVTDRSGQWEIWVMNRDGSHPHPLLPLETQAQLGLEYRGVNERMLNWLP